MPICSILFYPIAVIFLQNQHAINFVDKQLNLGSSCAIDFRDFTSFLTINFLLSTLRDWLVKLEAIALPNPTLFEK